MKKIIIFLAFIILSSPIYGEESLKDLQKQNIDIENALIPLREEMITLSGQIKYLDDKLESESFKKTLLDEKIEDLKTELISLTGENYETQSKREVQKRQIERLILELHREEKKYLSDGETNIFKLIFSPFGIESALQEKKILERIESLGAKIYKFFLGKEEEIDYEISKINELRGSISNYKDQIKEKEKQLSEIKKAKTALLDYTQGQEEKFRTLLKENKTAMLSILNEIKKSQGEIETYQNQIIKKEEEVKTNDIYDISKFEDLGEGFIWPVDPQRGITAKFLDKQYEDTFGLVHYGIDIRAEQRTEVRAAANAYVYKTQEAGLGYSYIILIHKGSIHTVYGHLSEIHVSTGDIVFKGDIIGLSGGRPGSPGSGLMTTGPHLHLEFHENGKPIDPLSILPSVKYN